MDNSNLSAKERNRLRIEQNKLALAKYKFEKLDVYIREQKAEQEHRNNSAASESAAEKLVPQAANRQPRPETADSKKVVNRRPQTTPLPVQQEEKPRSQSAVKLRPETADPRVDKNRHSHHASSSRPQTTPSPLPQAPQQRPPSSVKIRPESVSASAAVRKTSVDVKKQQEPLPASADAKPQIRLPEKPRPETAASARENKADDRKFSSPLEELHQQAKQVSPEFSKCMFVNDRKYTQFDKIGKGGSCSVYQCYSAFHKCTVAVKVVQLEDQPDVVKSGFINEVKLLKRLQKSKHVVKLFDCEIKDNDQEHQLYVVMEMGETDFSSYLNKNDLSSLSVRHFFSEMCKCVEAIHKEQIVHSDLKPANFLLVKGNLKLIDFGIASAIPLDETCAITPCQMGTLNYMCPERFIVSKDLPIMMRKTCDIWSLGCILYLMVFRIPPYHHYQHKKEAIVNGSVIDFKGQSDELFIDVVTKCLAYNYKDRPTVEELLRHPFLQSDSSSSSFYSSNSSINNKLLPAEELDENFIDTAAEELKKLNLTPRSTVKHLVARMNKNANHV